MNERVRAAVPTITPGSPGSGAPPRTPSPRDASDASAIVGHQWDSEPDEDRTIHLLLKQSGCFVGHALGAPIEAVGRDPRHGLAFYLMSEHDPNPLKF